MLDSITSSKGSKETSIQRTTKQDMVLHAVAEGLLNINTFKLQCAYCLKNSVMASYCQKAVSDAIF
jgi:hypothetical protein